MNTKKVISETENEGTQPVFKKGRLTEGLKS